MTLKIDMMADGKYICNWCNKSFNIKDAWNKKGNQCFCSRECVIEYSIIYDYEANREGG